MRVAKTHIVVLFNLKADADAAAYEEWARTTDLPIVRGLSSVDSFQAMKMQGLLGGDGQPPYQYAEHIVVNDMSRFGEEVASDTMRKVAGEFRQFADAPIFMLAESLD
jgi:hypothetical protein